MRYDTYENRRKRHDKLISHITGAMSRTMFAVVHGPRTWRLEDNGEYVIRRCAEAMLVAVREFDVNEGDLADTITAAEETYTEYQTSVFEWPHADCVMQALHTAAEDRLRITKEHIPHG